MNMTNRSSLSQLMGNLVRVLSGFVLSFMLVGIAHGQTLSQFEEQPVSKPVLMIAVLFILSVAPFILMMTTSFVKIAVVLSLVRSAIGTQQIPPNQIITGLALVLTVYVMIPVGQQIYNLSKDEITQSTGQDLFSFASIDVVKRVADKGKEPMRSFLLRHTHDQERLLFFNSAERLRVGESLGTVSDTDFIVLIPAFIISELSEAFQIGFIIFLPFLVIDMVVSNILLSMGMFQLSPVTVSLPFKLLLFVLVDGWALITEGLVNGYIVPK